jgi:transglutaminase-like putative cysteine protease
MTALHLQIEHHTEYHYENPVRYSIQELRLSPPATNGQTILNWRIQSPIKAKADHDAFGNTCHTFVLDSPYKTMSIAAKGEVKSTACHAYTDDTNAVSPYYLLQATTLTQTSAEMRAHFESVIPKKRDLDSILILADAIRNTVRYQSGITHFATTAMQSFAMKTGVCQDHSHIMLSLCRFAGIPARYVSGYFFAQESPNLASHAWVDVCIAPEKGAWLSIDVTHACPTDDRHIRLAIGRDYYCAAPIKGIRSGGGHEELSARISIQQIRVL